MNTKLSLRNEDNEDNQAMRIIKMRNRRNEAEVTPLLKSIKGDRFPRNSSGLRGNIFH